MFDDTETPARREGIIKAFNTGMRLIEEVQLGKTNGSPVKYLTFLTLRLCLTAATFLSKVLHSAYRQHVDIERGTNAFNATISICKQCCVEDNDMNGRATKYLAQLWTIHTTMVENSQQPPSLSIKSRLFFSIVHDSLWLWREKYAGQPNNGAPSLPPPLISPTASKTYLDPSPDGLSQTNPKLPAAPFVPPNGIMQATSCSDGVAGLSAFVDQQFAALEGFTANDPTRWPSSAVVDNNNMSRDIGHDSASAMGLEMLFPDGIVSCGEHTWYCLAR